MSLSPLGFTLSPVATGSSAVRVADADGASSSEAAALSAVSDAAALESTVVSDAGTADTAAGTADSAAGVLVSDETDIDAAFVTALGNAGGSFDSTSDITAIKNLWITHKTHVGTAKTDTAAAKVATAAAKTAADLMDTTPINGAIAGIVAGSSGDVVFAFDPSVITTKNQGKAVLDMIAARLQQQGLL